MAHLNLPRVQLQAGDHQFHAHVARSPEAREIGLMKRAELPDDEGMLFVCEQAAVQSFWMKDTPLPLSAAFLDEDGTVLQLADMEPHSLDGHSSETPVRFVLEMNRGWFDEKGVQPGTRIEGPPFATAGQESSR